MPWLPSILCSALPFVELLRQTTPSFQIRSHDPQFLNQIYTVGSYRAPSKECRLSERRDGSSDELLNLRHG